MAPIATVCNDINKKKVSEESAIEMNSTDTTSKYKKTNIIVL